METGSRTTSNGTKTILSDRLKASDGPSPAIGWSAALMLVTLVSATGGFLFGYDTAVINGANQYVSAHFHLTPTQEGFAGASAILGCIPGAFFAGFLGDRFGRKKTLFLCALLYAASGIWSALPTTFGEFLVARFLGGLGIGITSMICPLYIAECAPARIRGRLGTLFQFGIVVGISLTLFINKAISSQGDAAWNTASGWRWMLGAEAMPAIVFVLLLQTAPESPRWLLTRGREDEARRNMGKWMSASEVDAEARAVREAAAGESASFGDLFGARYRRPLIIALGVMAISQLSGINAIMYYSTKIFTTAGVGVQDAFTATALVGIVNLLFTFVAIALVEKVGRRGLLLAGLAVQVVSLSTCAVMFGRHTGGTPLLIAILAFIAAFAMALGPISWLLSSEIFPTKVRARAMSMAAFTVWVTCYIVAQTFPMLNDNPHIGPSITFWVYAAVSLVGLFFTFLLVPETKGRTLETIEASWSKPAATSISVAAAV